MSISAIVTRCIKRRLLCRQTVSQIMKCKSSRRSGLRDKLRQIAGLPVFASWNCRYWNVPSPPPSTTAPHPPQQRTYPSLGTWRFTTNHSTNITQKLRSACRRSITAIGSCYKSKLFSVLKKSPRQYIKLATVYARFLYTSVCYLYRDNIHNIY